MAGRRRSPGLSRRSLIRAVGGTLVAVPWLAACGSAPDPNTVRIQYQQFGSGTVMRDHLLRVVQQLSSQRPDITIELVPLVAAEADYFTKNELMMSSPNVTPDLVYEDTFILKSDVAAGYLRPIDELVRGWPVWEELTAPSQQAVTYTDGKVYAVPTHTDTRALWYHTGVFEAAGIEQPWQPGSWEDLLAAARQIKERVPDVVPLNIFSGEPQGEKASMQGFEMLLYGTQTTLFDEASQKWVVGGQGFVDALQLIQTVYTEGLAPSLGDALNPNIGDTIYNSWLPEGQLGINLDGSWISQNWGAGAAGEWPEWWPTLQLATMPTQTGAPNPWAPGEVDFVTLAGGWSWAFPALSTKTDLAWEVLQQMMTTENALSMALADNQVTIRADVRAEPDYQGYSPTIDFFTDLGESAIYRPAVAAYPEVSARIQAAMGQVMTGGTPPEEAAAEYDAAVTDLVGPDQVVEASA
ncbi:type 2 periplasmic-binding domain-containing protein [Desertihabitans aurantiacus]|uniref:extracellular solute-binding protein n=1 Tax=Desertihabitans aurantiacus TaxID=2282477 RepID=UPI000DF83D37|nr:extracellular solute-binding protein [Desertihabitans aurantiacus]